MFQSWYYTPNYKRNDYQYHIVDTDFQDVVRVPYANGVAAELGLAIIEVYSKRGLPVIPAFIAAMTSFPKHTFQYHYTFAQIIEDNKLYNTKFAQYEEELNKYLVLL